MALFGQGWAKLLAIIRPIDPEIADRLAVEAAPEMPEWGEVGNGRSRGSHRTSTRGEAFSYPAARFRRDRPDLTDEVEAARMSLRAAACAAGIIRDPTGFDALLLRARKKATPPERDAFLKWLDAHLKGEAA
jgi:hypothetical protein